MQAALDSLSRTWRHEGHLGKAILVILALVLSVSCGSQATPTRTPTRTPTPRPGCTKYEYLRFGGQAGPLFIGYTDTLKLAMSAAPIAALPSLVREMQQLHREWERLHPPQCWREYWEYIDEFMRSEIDGLLAFMAGEDESVVQSHFTRGTSALRNAQRARERAEKMVGD